jgi:hypothetical protein
MRCFNAHNKRGSAAAYLAMAMLTIIHRKSLLFYRLIRDILDKLDEVSALALARRADEAPASSILGG